MYSISVTLQGSLSSVSIPEDLSKILTNNKIYKINTQFEMEMDLPSIFYSLKFLEQLNPIDNNLYKKIFDCAYLPIKNEGFYIHHHWKENEVHLRFTSSALLYLVNEVRYNPNNAICLDIEKALEKHFSYGEFLDIGYWFFHDSHEKDGDFYPDYSEVKSNLWGKSFTNYLIFNTHIDTLILLETARDKGYNVNYKKYSKAYDSLNYIINLKPKLYHSIDSIIRNNLVKQKVVNPNGILHKFLLKYYARIRFKLKFKNPMIFYKDGFSEREIGLTGESLGYHLVNIWDMSRLMRMLQLNHLFEKIDLENAKIKLSKGFDFLINDSYYFDYILKYYASSCSKICESIIFSILLDRFFLKYLPLFYKSRINFENTPLFLNTDPLNPIGMDKEEAIVFHEFFNTKKIDYIKLNTKEVLLINYGPFNLKLNNEWAMEYKCDFLISDNLEINLSSNSYKIINLN